MAEITDDWMLETMEAALKLQEAAGMHCGREGVHRCDYHQGVLDGMDLAQARQRARQR